MIYRVVAWVGNRPSLSEETSSIRKTIADVNELMSIGYDHVEALRFDGSTLTASVRYVKTASGWKRSVTRWDR